MTYIMYTYRTKEGIGVVFYQFHYTIMFYYLNYYLTHWASVAGS